METRVEVKSDSPPRGPVFGDLKVGAGFICENGAVGIVINGSDDDNALIVGEGNWYTTEIGDDDRVKPVNLVIREN